MDSAIKFIRDCILLKSDIWISCNASLADRLNWRPPIGEKNWHLTDSLLVHFLCNISRAILFVILIKKSNRLRLSWQPIRGLKGSQLTNQDPAINSSPADNQKDRSWRNCLDHSQQLECHDLFNNIHDLDPSRAIFSQC